MAVPKLLIQWLIQRDFSYRYYLFDRHETAPLIRKDRIQLELEFQCVSLSTECVQKDKKDN